MTSSSRRLAAVLLTATLTAGCGQATSSAPPPPSTHARIDPELLANAASATTRTGSARISMQMQMSESQGSFNAHANGVMSFSRPVHGTLTMQMNLPNSPTPVSMTERMLGTTLYMHMPFLNASAPQIKPWIKLDLGALGKAEGLNLGALMNSNTNDPASILGYLKGVSGQITVVGHETVNAVQTTHYRATVNYAKAIANMRRTNPAAATALQQSIDKTGTRTAPVDVWVDGSGLMRQERVSVAMPALGGSMTIVLSLSDFGVPVHVSAPPASQTTDLLKMLRSQGAGGTA
jgi:hypothetical protein